MATSPAKENFRHELHMLALLAHKNKKVSWKNIHEVLTDESRAVWARHQEMLTLFPENRKRRK